MDHYKTIQQFSGTAREFLGIDPGLAVVAAARDPCIYEYQGALRQSTDEWASTATASGSKAITPEDYIATAAALQPDVLVTLSDEVPCDSKRERAVASVDRTLQWLPRCLRAVASITPAVPSLAIFASVQGAQFPDQRRRCAEGLAAHTETVAGICVGGLGTGESPQLRQELISEILACISPEKPRMVASIGSPEGVIDAIGQGIDLFDVSYIADVTSGGYALTFPVSPEEEEKMAATAAHSHSISLKPNGQYEPAELGSDDSKINLWASGYSTDARPFVDGCMCLACTAHTRAYVHHLLESHEMTAQVLLEAHNTAHYLRFFAALRCAIAAGKFREYVAWVADRKQRWHMGLPGIL